MAQNYYGDSEDSASTDTATASPETSKDESSEGTKTAVIDSAICPGMSVGTEIVLKIDKILDRQYLVSYSPEPEDESSDEGGDEPSEAPEPAPAGGMSSMME